MLPGDTVIMLLTRLCGWVGLEIPSVPSPVGKGEISIYSPICETGGKGGQKWPEDLRGWAVGPGRGSGLAFSLPHPSASQLLEGLGM